MSFKTFTISETSTLNDLLKESCSAKSKADELSESIFNPKTMYRVIDETVEISEFIKKVGLVRKIINETVALTEANVRSMSIVRAINEIEQLIEIHTSDNRILNNLRKIINETVQISEAKNEIRELVGKIGREVKTAATSVNIRVKNVSGKLKSGQGTKNVRTPSS